MCICVHFRICVSSCGKATSDVAFKPGLFSESLSGLKLTHLARLAGQKAPRIHLRLPELGALQAYVSMLTFFYTALGLELKSSCLRSKLFTELSL